MNTQSLCAGRRTASFGLGRAAGALLVVLHVFFRNARIRYAASCAALFAMPIAFVVTLALLYPRPSSFSKPMHWPPAAASLCLAGSSHVHKPASAESASAIDALVRALLVCRIVLFYLRSAGSCCRAEASHAGVNPRLADCRYALATWLPGCTLRGVTLLESCM